MQPGASKEGRLKFPYVIHQTVSRCAELGQNLYQLPAVVIGFMSLAIAQVHERERASIRQKVVYTRHQMGTPDRALSQARFDYLSLCDEYL